MILNPGCENFFEELARNFIANGKRMRVLLAEKLGYRKLRDDTLVELDIFCKKILKQPLIIKSIREMSFFKVNDTTVVNRSLFIYGSICLPALELEFEDADWPNYIWIGTIQGKKNIETFIEHVAALLNAKG